MAKLSDEIRRWCDDAYSGRKIRTTKDLYAIADLVEREMVELPKDKDGEPIHVGDKVYLDDGRMACVTEIDIMQDGRKTIECWDGSRHVACHPSCIAHTRHDSLESIADDMYKFAGSDGVDTDVCDFLSDIADRIRELAENEG